MLCTQVAEVAQILDFLSTQTSLPIVGISGGSAVVIPYKVAFACTAIHIAITQRMLLQLPLQGLDSESFL